MPEGISSVTPRDFVSTRARLVVVETVYHQPPGEQPTETDSRYAKWLDTQEQPYVRKCKVGEDWKPLDTGWLEQASLLILVNEEGGLVQVNPTDEEKQATAGRVIEVACVPAREPPRTMHSPPCIPLTATWLVHPGESMRATPADLSALRIRCRSGEARCTLTLYPL